MKKILLVFIIALTGILMSGCSKDPSSFSGEYVRKGEEIQMEPLKRYYVEISKEERTFSGDSKAYRQMNFTVERFDQTYQVKYYDSDSYALDEEGTLYRIFWGVRNQKPSGKIDAQKIVWYTDSSSGFPEYVKVSSEYVPLSEHKESIMTLNNDKYLADHEKRQEGKRWLDRDPFDKPNLRY